jgi:hypothetical protein
MLRLAPAVLVIASLAAAAAAAVPTYTGSLSVGSGLVATELWNDVTTTLSYSVIYNPGTQTWSYSYTLSVPEKNISHFIIEVSPSFTLSNLLDTSWSVSPAGTALLGTNNVSPANTYMPEDLYGIKFTPGGVQQVTVTIESDRSPIWGDFYGRCGFSDGILNTAYNTGFSSPDSDPSILSIPLGDNPGGLLTNHILVPDTVPEPLTLSVLVLGGLAMMRRRARA